MVTATVADHRYQGIVAGKVSDSLEMQTNLFHQVPSTWKKALGIIRNAFSFKGSARDHHIGSTPSGSGFILNRFNQIPLDLFPLQIIFPRRDKLSQH